METLTWYIYGSLTIKKVSMMRHVKLQHKDVSTKQALTRIASGTDPNEEVVEDENRSRMRRKPNITLIPIPFASSQRLRRPICRIISDITAKASIGRKNNRQCFLGREEGGGQTLVSLQNLRLLQCKGN